MPTNRKDAILDSAVSCFSRHGYEKTTMEDIAEMVGLDKSSLYHYYKNKEAVFAAALFREAAGYSEKAKKEVEGIENCKNKIISWLQNSFTYKTNSALLHMISGEEMKKLSPEFRKNKTDVMNFSTEFYRSALEEGRRHGEIVDCDAQKVAQTITNISNAIRDSALMNARTYLFQSDDYEKMVEEILYSVSLILDGIIVK